MSGLARRSAALAAAWCASCADPCLDDGFGQEKCELTSSAGSSEDTGPGSTISTSSGATLTSADTTGSSQSGSTDASSDSSASESGATETGATESASETGATDTTGGVQQWCLDADDDGFGDATQCQDSEDPPGPDWVPNDDDCDDGDPLVVMGCAPCKPGAQCVMEELHTCNDNGTFTFVEPCEFGCDEIALQCNFAPLSVQTGPDVDIMAGGNTGLMCIAMGGDGNYAYAWDNSATLDDAMIADPVASPSQTTTYTCTVTDGQPVMGADSTTVHVTDAPIDFSSCSIVEFGIDEGPDPADWAFQMQGTRACETENGEPSAVVCDFVLDNAAVTGQFAVETGQDDDSIGFVFGWQDVGHFYVFSWKQAGQDFVGCGTLPEGMTIKRIDSDMGLTCPDLMGDADTAVSVALATPATFFDQGWIGDEQYVFELLHTPMDFTITVYLASDMSVIASTTVVDATYPSGQFGLFAFSQVDSCFESFTTQSL